MTRPTMLAALLVSSLAACAVSDDDPVPADQAEPTATFTSRTGTTIQLFGSRTGFSALERGEATLPQALRQDDVATLSPSELYVEASGNAVVPQEIEALTLRLGASAKGTRNVRSSSPGPAPALNGCSSASFTAAGKCPSGEADWCLLNWWNGAYEHFGDVWYSDAYLCVKQGSVLWQIRNGEGGFHQWTVSTGQLFHYFFNDGLDSSWLYYDVLNASGDQFQFGGMAMND